MIKAIPSEFLNICYLLCTYSRAYSPIHNYTYACFEYLQYIHTFISSIFSIVFNPSNFFLQFCHLLFELNVW